MHGGYPLSRHFVKSLIPPHYYHYNGWHQEGSCRFIMRLLFFVIWTEFAVGPGGVWKQRMLLIPSSKWVEVVGGLYGSTKLVVGTNLVPKC